MGKTFFKLHLSILLAGFTGIFGKLITLNEGMLVWYRTLLASVLYMLFLIAIKKLPRVSGRDFFRIAKVGAVLSLHWIFFYGSIKASNVSIGVVCFSLVGLFTAVLEPIMLHRQFSARELIYSLITLLGVMLIFSFDTRYQFGITLGIISAAFASLFTIMTKKINADYPPRTILLYEMIGGFLMISLLLPIYLHFNPTDSILPTKLDIVWLLLFVILCTIGLQLLQIQVLRKVSAFTVNLSYNLEPVYSIILAMAFFGEAKELNFSFYIGVSLVILSVLLQTFDSIRNRKQKKSTAVTL